MPDRANELSLYFTKLEFMLFQMTVRKSVLLVLLLCFQFLSSTVNAGLFGKQETPDPRPVNEVFLLTTDLIDKDQLLLRWDILDGYYLYDNRMKITDQNEKEVSEISRSQSKAKDDPLFGKVEVYYHSSEIVLDLNKYSGQKSLVLNIGYQGCWDGGVCYPPVSEVRQIDLPAVILDDEQTNLTSEPATANQSAPLVGSASQQDYFSTLLSDANLAWIMAVFFVAGLALSFTPCVLPMVPIISSIIVGQGENVTKRRAFSLTLVYVLSVAFTYTIAGVLAGMFGENLQALLQADWIIILFSVVFVLLALSMFGLFEMQLPAALQGKLANASNKQRNGNYWGVAVMGVLSALIVGPCMAAPLAGALIYIAQSADPVLGGLALFSLSIGMGVPLILVGLSAGHFLPKVGAWMSNIKAAFGVVLIFMAIYMLDRVVSIEVTQLLTAITTVISAVFMGALSPIKTSSSAVMKLLKGLGMLALVYGLSLLVGVFIGNAKFMQPLQGITLNKNAQQAYSTPFTKITSLAQLTPILQQAKSQGLPVMLDFYADWCISCVEIEQMFEESEVATQLAKMRLVKVDLTDFNQTARALLEKYQVLGPPALVFYNASGLLETRMTIVGLVPSQAFLRHIKPLLTQ